MNIQVRRVEYADVAALRELFRQEANCEIVHDSFLARGLADPYLILVEGRVAGYGGIGNKYPAQRLTCQAVASRLASGLAGPWWTSPVWFCGSVATSVFVEMSHN